ncbi:MAG: hypothetical protein V3569_01325 [Acholeplasmataceae bacterium]|nr:hypothetical protein [Acholeplasmataceae bacterium]
MIPTAGYDGGKKIDYIESIIDFGLKSDDLKDDLKKLSNRKTNKVLRFFTFIKAFIIIKITRA